jgi:hypothetical protein
MSTIAATNLKNASSGSNNIVLGTGGDTTITNNLTVSGTGNHSIAGTLQFNSGYGSAATAYGCRAWVNFNGTGTVAIRASGNVSSITDNGTGDYTVNFTTALADANYCTVATSNVNTTGSGNRVVSAPYAASPTVSALRLACFRADTAVFEDHAFINVAIFR